MIIITTLTNDHEINQLLTLQQKNLARYNTQEVIESQGFVTVEHTFELLKEMNETNAQIIAKDDNKLVGYALIMHEKFRYAIPVLEPMFAMLPHLQWNKKYLTDYTYYVMGQICVDEAYRGQGLFDRLYYEQREQLKQQYQLCITEVATRNTRSMRAHQRVGFKVIWEYEAPDGEQWAVIGWDLHR